LRKRLAAATVLAVVFSCGSPEGNFTSGRIEDPCAGTWPVCNTVAGCILGETNYAGGNFPGSFTFIVSTLAPSTISVNVFLQNVTGAGSTTTITWFETGCTASFPQQTLGSVFVGESQQQGFFTASQAVVGVGDHEITIVSDATASFLFSVNVVPTTNTGS
jgi:hypothetical protein